MEVIVISWNVDIYVPKYRTADRRRSYSCSPSSPQAEISHKAIILAPRVTWHCGTSSHIWPIERSDQTPVNSSIQCPFCGDFMYIDLKALILNWCVIGGTTLTLFLFHLCCINWLLLYDQSDRLQNSGQVAMRFINQQQNKFGAPSVAWQLRRHSKLYNILFFLMLKSMQCKILCWTFFFFRFFLTEARSGCFEGEVFKEVWRYWRDTELNNYGALCHLMTLLFA